MPSSTTGRPDHPPPTSRDSVDTADQCTAREPAVTSAPAATYTARQAAPSRSAGASQSGRRRSTSVHKAVDRANATDPVSNHNTAAAHALAAGDVELVP